MIKLYLLKLLRINLVNKKFKPEAKIQFDFVNRLRTLSLENKLKCIWFAVSNETGTNANPKYGKTLQMLGKLAGAPDLVLMWENGCGCIEIKTASGTQSPKQKYFQSWCLDNGVKYKIVRSVDEGLLTLLEWDVIKDENQSSRYKFN